MLISKRHKFIFVHIWKTAGTSISHSLLPYAATWWEIGLSKVFRRLHLPKRTPWTPYESGKHFTAQEIIDRMGEEEFRSFFSFAVVRNPWDWQVSLYTFILKTEIHYLHEKVKRMGTFDNYVHWRCESDYRLQKEFIYSADGQLLVDHVARYENLEHDFAEICKRIGVVATLPTLNVSNTKPYQSFYTDETRRMVAEAYAPDIELLGYSFATDSS